MINKKVERICNVEYSLLQAANMFVTAVLSAFLVPLLNSQGFGANEIGMLIAIKCCAMIVFSPIYAGIADRLSDRISNRLFICLFCLAGIAVTLVHIYVPLNFAGAILIFFGYGASFTCVGPFVDSLSSQYVARGIRINYAFARAMGSLFWALAGLVLGYLTTRFSSDAVLWLQIIALIVCMISALICKEPNKLGDKPLLNENEQIKPGSLLNMLKESKLFTGYLVALLFLMTGVNMTMSYMAYTVEGVGGTSFDLGLYEFILGFMEVFVGLYFAWFHRKLGTIKVLIIGMLSMTLRVVVLVFAPNMFWVYIAQIFELTGCMLWAGNVKIVEDEIQQKDRVKGQAMIGNVQTGIAVLTASLLGGYLMENLKDVFYIHISAAVLGMVGVVILVMLDMVRKSNMNLVVGGTRNESV